MWPFRLKSSLESSGAFRGFTDWHSHILNAIYMDSGDYERLQACGVKFQCNITSLTEAYGKDAYRKFSTLLAKGWIRALGTDIHRLSSFNRAIERKSLSYKQRTLLLNNILKSDKGVTLRRNLQE